MELMTEEKFQNVCKMLESPDQENKVLALSIIEAHDFQGNLAFILLAMKYGFASNALWEENSPEIYAKLKAIKCIDLDKALTFKNIMEALAEQKAPHEQGQFFLNVFSKYLFKQIAVLGYDFIEDIELVIKLKPEYEQNGKPVEGDQGSDA